MRDAGLLDQRLGLTVIGGKGYRAAFIRVGERRIYDMRNTGVLRGGDRVTVRGKPFARLKVVRRDDQQPPAAGKGRTKSGRVIEIACPDVDPTPQKGRELFRRAGSAPCASRFSMT